MSRLAPFSHLHTHALGCDIGQAPKGGVQVPTASESVSERILERVEGKLGMRGFYILSIALSGSVILALPYLLYHL